MGVVWIEIIVVDILKLFWNKFKILIHQISYDHLKSLSP